MIGTVHVWNNTNWTGELPTNLVVKVKFDPPDRTAGAPPITTTFLVRVDDAP